MKYFKGSRSKRSSAKRKSTDTTSEISQETSVTSHRGRKRAVSPSISASSKEPVTGRTKRTKHQHSTSKESASNKTTHKINLQSSNETDTEAKSPRSPKKISYTRSKRVATRSAGNERDEPSKHTSKKRKTNPSLPDAPTTRKTSGRAASQRATSSTSKTSPKDTSSDAFDGADSAFESTDKEIEQRRAAPKEGTDISSGDLSSDGRLGVLSDGEFMKNQVKLLRSCFEIKDCPELAAEDTKKKQKSHIARDTVLKIIKKLNYKVDDDLMRNLNRQEQRKILKQIQEIRHAHRMQSSSDNDVQQGSENNLEKLKQTLKSHEKQLAGLQEFTDLAVKVVSLTDDISDISLAKVVKHTNKLVQQILDKVKKQDYVHTTIPPTTKDTLNHQDIIDTLFNS